MRTIQTNRKEQRQRRCYFTSEDKLKERCFEIIEDLDLFPNRLETFERRGPGLEKLQSITLFFLSF